MFSAQKGVSIKVLGPPFRPLCIKVKLKFDKNIPKRRQFLNPYLPYNHVIALICNSVFNILQPIAEAITTFTPVDSAWSSTMSNVALQ